jgi:hypothetical protein
MRLVEFDVRADVATRTEHRDPLRFVERRRAVYGAP